MKISRSWLITEWIEVGCKWELARIPEDLISVERATVRLTLKYTMEGSFLVKQGKPEAGLTIKILGLEEATHNI